VEEAMLYGHHEDNEAMQVNSRQQQNQKSNSKSSKRP
jgi:hypothetical protein